MRSIVGQKDIFLSYAHVTINFAKRIKVELCSVLCVLFGSHVLTCMVHTTLPCSQSSTITCSASSVEASPTPVCVMIC